MFDPAFRVIYAMLLAACCGAFIHLTTEFYGLYKFTGNDGDKLGVWVYAFCALCAAVCSAVLLLLA